MLDRFIQQAVMQVLQEAWDDGFSASSYGFRPARSAHQAVAAAQAFIVSGHRVVVDIDLEKFLEPLSNPLVHEACSKRLGMLSMVLIDGA